jgi:ribosomal protein RSM22 (predicted rRNA methylase)
MSLVQIPIGLADAIEALASGAPPGDAARLSAAYRDQRGHAVLFGDAGKRAYLASRFPATFAAAWRVLSRAQDLGLGPFESVLDCGCGPGTASLAAAALWPEIGLMTRSDIDASWRPFADRLSLASGHAAANGARWLTGAMDHLSLPVHDAAIACYALNEVPAERRAAAVENLWQATGSVLVLIEPGTPQGFLNIRDARGALLSLGAFAAAPCTHHAPCPMSEADWCHHSVRVARSEVHLNAKGGTLPFEDEKFSYLIATRAPVVARPISRIVKRPIKRSGHVTLDLCTQDGLARTIISRRQGGTYKAARDADWGDGWPPTQS